MQNGLDALAYAKYAKLIQAELPSTWWLGVFGQKDLFGDPIPGLREHFDKRPPPGFRVQLHWEDDHKEKRDTFKKIQAEAKRWDKFLKPFVGAFEIKVSGWCEHTLDAKKAEQLHQMVGNEINFPFEYVNSPWGVGALLKTCRNEVHNSPVRVPNGLFDYGYDGDNAFDNNTLADRFKFKDAGIYWWWINQCNGNPKSYTPPNKPAPRPTRKHYLTSRLIDALVYLSRDDLRTGKLPQGWIFKSVSDQHAAPPAGKDCKPVIITPVGTKPKEIQLRARNGQIIDRARYFGTFNDGNKLLGYRYYCTDWGFLLAEKARRIQGDSLCDVFADGKKVGTHCPALRGGTFR